MPQQADDGTEQHTGRGQQNQLRAANEIEKPPNNWLRAFIAVLLDGSMGWLGNHSEKIPRGSRTPSESANST